MTGKWSLTVVTAFVTSEKHYQTVIMTVKYYDVATSFTKFNNTYSENVHEQFIIRICKSYLVLEAVALRYSVKKVFLEILQNSQGNTCARV